jgi:hypothetical protein
VEQVLGRDAQSEQHHFCEPRHSCSFADTQNRTYGTSQIKDLNKKIQSASFKLSDTAAELKAKPLPPASNEPISSKGKGKKDKPDFPGVEMTPTVLTGPVKDG